MQYFNQNIKTIRLYFRLSQKQFAENLEVKPGTYNNWEKDTLPSVAEVVRIAERFQISTDDLLLRPLKLSDVAQNHPPPENIVLEPSANYGTSLPAGNGESERLLKDVVVDLTVERKQLRDTIELSTAQVKALVELLKMVALALSGSDDEELVSLFQLIDSKISEMDI